MNPLTHVLVSKRLIDEHNLNVNEDLCLLGSILPDICCLNVIPYKPSHYDALGFIHYLMEKDPEYVSLGYGFLLHSENFGVDKYTHENGGFIDQHEMAMYEIVKKYKHKMHGGQLKDFIHSLIEFACDSFLSAREADLLINAFNNVDLEKVAYHISVYFDGDGKKIHKILQFLGDFDWHDCTHVKGVAKTWDRWLFYEELANSSGVNMMKHLSHAWTLFKHNNTMALLEEARDYLRNIFPVYVEFLHDEMSKTIIKQIPSTTRVQASH